MIILTCKKHPQVTVEITEKEKIFRPISFANIPNCVLFFQEKTGTYDGCEVEEIK